MRLTTAKSVKCHVMEINFNSATFITSAQTLEQCPPEHGAEVAFAGRSNSGKSSAINKLTRNKGLAHKSKTPGRTQLINFFKLETTPDFRLVDLPGYGYAKVSKEVKEKWEQDLSRYLHERESLRGIILLMDIRHPLQDLDVVMINWAVESDMPVHVLMNKCDKLSRGAAKSALLKFQKEMEKAGVSELVSSQTFSAQNGDGLPELARQITNWLQAKYDHDKSLKNRLWVSDYLLILEWFQAPVTVSPTGLSAREPAFHGRAGFRQYHR